MMYCYLLKKLEETTGKKISEIFDLVAGTSIGSIVAALLVSDKTAQECIQFFIDDAPVIFKKKWYKFGLFSPLYSADIIENILKEKLENKTLKNCKTKLLVPAFNLTTEDPFFFKSYEGKDYPLWAVCRASASAPVYFSAFKYEKNIFWDGGLFANSAEIPALADAIKLKWNIKTVKILSLGCGDYPIKGNPDKFINCGILRNLIRIFPVLFTSGSEDENYISKQIMGDNFLVINPEVKEVLKLGNASPKIMQKREELGEQWVKDHFWEIKEFLT